MRTWMDERMEKEEKNRLAQEAREKRALFLAEQPVRRSGRLIVSSAQKVESGNICGFGVVPERDERGDGGGAALG